MRSDTWPGHLCGAHLAFSNYTSENLGENGIEINISEDRFSFPQYPISFNPRNVLLSRKNKKLLQMKAPSLGMELDKNCPASRY